MTAFYERQMFAWWLIVVSILSFVASIGIKISNPKAGLLSELDWLILVLVSLWIPLLTIQIWVQIVTPSHVKEIKSDLVKALGQREIVHLGPANDVANMVKGRVESANQVFNTYIASNSPYADQVHKSITDSIAKFLTSDNVLCFQETCTEAGKTRAKCVREKLRDRENSGKSLPDGYQERYQVRVLNSELTKMPACNFIILKHDSAEQIITQEVFFGWGYFNRDTNTSVFWSKDPDLIQFFESYHRALRCDSVSKKFDPWADEYKP